ncbi:MAG: RDD family protein [Vicinamibacterales bacterium]
MDPSHLRIDTPEQISLELPVAGVGSRFLAMAIDTLLQAVLYLVIVAILFFLPVLRFFVGALGGTYLPAVLFFTIFCIYWGYFAAFEIAWRGQTPGKRVMGLRVVRDSGRPVDAAASLLRNLLRAVDALPVFYGVGVICMLLNRRSKRIGDLVAGTVVVYDRQTERLDTTWAERSDPGTGPPAAVRLSDAELTLVETFLARRNELEWLARERAGEQVARRLTERLGLRPEPGQTIEEFLESLARRTRDTARFR